MGVVVQQRVRDVLLLLVVLAIGVFLPPRLEGGSYASALVFGAGPADAGSPSRAPSRAARTPSPYMARMTWSGTFVPPRAVVGRLPGGADSLDIRGAPGGSGARDEEATRADADARVRLHDYESRPLRDAVGARAAARTRSRWRRVRRASARGADSRWRSSRWRSAPPRRGRRRHRAAPERALRGETVPIGGPARQYALLDPTATRYEVKLSYPASNPATVHPSSSTTPPPIHEPRRAAPCATSRSSPSPRGRPEDAPPRTTPIPPIPIPAAGRARPGSSVPYAVHRDSPRRAARGPRVRHA